MPLRAVTETMEAGAGATGAGAGATGAGAGATGAGAGVRAKDGDGDANEADAMVDNGVEAEARLAGAIPSVPNTAEHVVPAATFIGTDHRPLPHR